MALKLTGSFGSKSFTGPLGVGTHNSAAYKGADLGRGPFPSASPNYPNQPDVSKGNNGTNVKSGNATK
jgi:hypothetical protein